MASRSIPRFLVMFMILSCGNCGAFARTKEATPNAFGANRHESEKAKRVCPRITCPHCYRVAGAARINANDSQLRIFFRVHSRDLRAVRSEDNEQGSCCSAGRRAEPEARVPSEKILGATYLNTLSFSEFRIRRSRQGAAPINRILGKLGISC